MAMALEIHGGSVEDPEPAIDGLLLTVATKLSSAVLPVKLLGLNPPATSTMTATILKEFSCKMYNSEENALRSLNIYYCSNVLGKNKYLFA